MNLNIKNKVGARFKLIAHKGDGIPTKETDWNDNIVLDSGLSRMFTGVWIDRCCVGSGNSTPTATQTALDSFIASTTTSIADSAATNSTTEPYYKMMRRTWRFNEGAAAGNISEVGMGWGDNALWNRALIRDTNGNPTTITVLSDEYLDIIAEIRFYVESSIVGSFYLTDKNNDVVSEHTYTGVPYLSNDLTWHTGKLDFAYKAVYSAPILSITQTPSTAPLETGRSAGWTVLTGVQRSALSLGLSAANSAQHKTFLIAIDFYSGLYRQIAAYQIEISPPISKQNTQVMTYTFEMSWDRYEPT